MTKTATKPIDKHNKKGKNIALKILLVFSILIVSILLAGLTYFSILYNKYNLNIEKLTSVNNGIKVYSASWQNNSLYNSNRTIVEIEKLPDYVVNAFVNIEDKRFYKHNGYDLKRIVKAGIVNFSSKSKSQGASTISQQLIKNALLTNEKTYERKIKEIVLAIKMEKKFSKQQILEMYLNTIYFGQNAYGIENASQIYFGKSAKDLTLNEACFLAGIIKSPAKYSPKNNYELAKTRRNVVAKAMLEQKSITEEQYKQVVESEIKTTTTPTLDASYEREAIYEACSLLNISERELINNDYQIITNKDENVQKHVVEINQTNLQNAKTQFNCELDSISILADNSGKILAYYVNSNYNLHNMKRQPASLLKPLAVYLPCFKQNILSPATLILDEPINYNGFSPQNAGGDYYGYVPTKYAIANSLNIPAVKALDYVGLENACSTLADLGINIANDDINLSLALGAVKNGVELIQILNAYSTIANYGMFKPLSFINKIIDKDNKTIYSSSDFCQNVADEQSCFLLTDCLKQTGKTGTAKRFNDLGFDVASKTGTAFNGEHNTDTYNLAFTTNHTLLTWIANVKDNALNDNIHSSNQPTEINKQILSQLYLNNKPATFSVPDGVELAGYDVTEYEKNHIIVAPNSNLDRFVAYDYFKTENKPEPRQIDQQNMTVDLDKYGSKITFNVLKNMHYDLFKNTTNNQVKLATISEKTDTITINDADIFKFDEITYILKCNNQIVSTVKIMPKKYLLNLLESQMLNGKSRWFV